MRNLIISAIFTLIPLSAHAEVFPLNGSYQLDFYASSGRCENDLYVHSSDVRMVLQNEPNAWGNRYRLGSFCLDRTFGEFIPVEDCTMLIETSSLTDNNRKFENVWTGITSRGTWADENRLTLSLLSDTRLQAHAVRYDQNGTVERPVYRCIYDKTN